MLTGGAAGPSAAPALLAAPSAEVQATMITSIVEMGFSADAARAALEGVHWGSVEAALPTLLG